MPSSMNELVIELQGFEREHKTAIDKVTEGLAAFDEKHEAALKRLDNIEEKQRQKPARWEYPGSLAEQLVAVRELQSRPAQLSKGQMFTFDINTKAAVSGVSRSVPYVTGVVSPGPTPMPRLRSVIPTASFSGAGGVLYTRENSYTNNAAPVAENAAKPEST